MSPPPAWLLWLVVLVVLGPAAFALAVGLIEVLIEVLAVVGLAFIDRVTP